MYSLQTSVQVGQESFHIRNDGDYRMILDCFEAMNDKDLSELERMYVAVAIFYDEFEDADAVLQRGDIIDNLYKGMIDFINCGETERESNTRNYKVIDWQKDSNLICSAINNVAKTEIRALDYLHWWTFMGYYNAIGECTLSNIVSIRYKTAKGEKLEKYEKKFKQDNPEYFNLDMRSAEQKRADEYIQSLWG